MKIGDDNLEMLSPDKMRALSAIVERALGEAAAVFSEMVNQEIRIDVPNVEMVPLKSIADEAGGPEHVGVGIYMGLTGDGNGHVILFFSEQSTYQLLDLILEVEPGTTRSLGEMEISALSELGNVTGSSFLNHLADQTNLELLPTTPAVALDMLGAILSCVLADLFTSGSQALLVETKFRCRQAESVSGYFFLLPQPQSLSLILDRLEG